MEGWRDYLKNPAPGNALIQADNPKMTDGQLADAVEDIEEDRRGRWRRRQDARHRHHDGSALEGDLRFSCRIGLA